MKDILSMRHLLNYNEKRPYSNVYESWGRMSQRWLKRQMLSYLPLLFLVIFILLAVMFLMLVQQSRQDVVRANAVFAKHVGQMVDYNLKNVEKQLLFSITQNDKIKEYLYNEPIDDEYFRKYEISNELGNSKVANPLIDSFYLYRSEDQMILSANMLMSLDRFADSPFIQSNLEGSGSGWKWSNARLYRDNNVSDRGTPVVSLVSKYPPPSGDAGLIVVNVRVSELERLVRGMTSTSDISYAQLVGTDGKYIFIPDQGEENEVLQYTRSDYTGWEIRTGIVNGYLYSLSTRFFYWMLGSASALLILGACWIFYTARHHYKPIQTIIHRILYASSTKNNIFQEQSVEVRDEFAFIEEAFQHLTEQVTEYQREQEEGLGYKRRHKLSELASGDLIWNRAEWKKEAGKLLIPCDFQSVSAAIIEVDHYEAFLRKYSAHDQYLFQFVIHSVLLEIAHEKGTGIWAEWLEGHRMSIIILNPKDQPMAKADTDIICRKVSEWVRSNLDFSITLGVSGCICDPEQIYLIHSQALEALHYKFIKGSGQVIHHDHVNEGNRGEVYRLIPLIRSLAYYYRIGDSRWKGDLNQMFQEWISGMYSRSDVYYLLNNIIHNLQREILELPNEVYTYWREWVIPELERILSSMETIEETECQLNTTLVKAEGKLAEFREKRRHHSLILDVRMYIDDHYTNPNLSLKHLEDTFGISGKYISSLFREETGEKFVDYLSKLRMKQAEELLLKSEATVQDIAAQVGYTNAMTFIRGFKKQFGMTPGDFRKIK